MARMWRTLGNISVNVNCFPSIEKHGPHDPTNPASIDNSGKWNR